MLMSDGTSVGLMGEMGSDGTSSVPRPDFSCSGVIGGLNAGFALSDGGGLILLVVAMNCGGEVSAMMGTGDTVDVFFSKRRRRTTSGGEVVVM